MSIRAYIIQLIERDCVLPIPVTDDVHLFEDLDFDSLSFVHLLMELEDAYSITFDLLEMEQCLRVGQLIALVEQKAEGSDEKHA